MSRRAIGAISSAVLAAALSACAAAYAQQDPQQQLRPPPAYEREYQTYCRDRPAACAGGYGQARDDFLTKRQDDAMDVIRRREQESQQLQQQPRR